jgi:DNA-binding CsgD family transcriptional regulator
MSTILKEIIQETNRGKRETIAKEYMETLQSRKEIAQKYDIHADSVSNYVNEFYPSMKWRINHETGEFSKVLNRAGVYKLTLPQIILLKKLDLLGLTGHEIKEILGISYPALCQYRKWLNEEYFDEPLQEWYELKSKEGII